MECNTLSTPFTQPSPTIFLPFPKNLLLSTHYFSTLPTCLPHLVLTPAAVWWQDLTQGRQGRVSSLVAPGPAQDGQLRSPGRDYGHQGGAEGEGHGRRHALGLQPPPVLLAGQQGEGEGEGQLVRL